MNFLKIIDGLNLNNDLSLNKNISEVLAYDLPFIETVLFLQRHSLFCSAKSAKQEVYAC